MLGLLTSSFGGRSDYYVATQKSLLLRRSFRPPLLLGLSPRIDSNEIGRHALQLSSLLGLISQGIIFPLLHCEGNSPSSIEAWKSGRTCLRTTGQTSFHTTAGSPSQPAAFPDFAANTFCSSSSIVSLRHINWATLRPSPFRYRRYRVTVGESGHQCLRLFALVFRPSPVRFTEGLTLRE